MNLIIGIALVAIAFLLLFLGWPNKRGEPAPFLQFEAALVLFPPCILVFFVMGAAEILTALYGK